MKKQTRKPGIKGLYSRFLAILESRPLATFSVALVLVVGLIFLSSYLRTPKISPVVEQKPKQVKLFQIGTVPTVSFQGQVEKSGTTTIVALAGGVVQKVNVRVGQVVGRGQTLISLSQNYQGGNTASLARAISGKQRDLADSTYNTQLDIISKQRDLGRDNRDNFTKMAEMSRAAASDTHDVIDLNNQIISSLESSLNLLSADPVGNAATILSTKQYLVQFKGSNAQLASSLRSAELQGDVSNPATAIATTQYDILVKQLDLQAASLSLSRDLADLSFRVAQINESMFFPAAPYKGTIQRVFVHPGQFVAPGTPLVAIAENGSQSADIVVLVPSTIASQVSSLVPSTITFANQSISITPSFVSTEAVSGGEHTITYQITGNQVGDLTDKSYVKVEIPLGNPGTMLTTTPTIPVDSVYQTENQSTVFVKKDGKATAVNVELGGVMGDYVQVKSGLTTNDQVILDRSVTDGQLVEE